MPERILRLKVVLDRTGLSRSTLYRKMAEGSFPRQLKISVRSSGWYESELECWIADPASFGDAPNSKTGQSARSRL
jgi:prophage regulatory protein